MGFIDRLRNIASMPDENYYDGDAMADGYGYDDQADAQDDIYAPQETHAQRRVRYDNPAQDDVTATRVVDINSNSQSKMVFKKVEKFDETGGLAADVNAKRIVILNLETCPSDVIRRVLDYTCGVADANGAKVQRIAGRAWAITPTNIPFNGEMLEQVENTMNP